jgi:hypothetical protein
MEHKLSTTFSTVRVAMRCLRGDACRAYPSCLSACTYSKAYVQSGDIDAGTGHGLLFLIIPSLNCGGRECTAYVGV